MSKRLLITTALLIAACGLVGLALLLYPAIYRGRIYPGVSVQGTDLGGLALDEATTRLIETLPDPTAQTVELHGDERLWEITWADVGRGYDAPRIARTAYQVARAGSWIKRITAPWQVRARGRSVELQIDPADAGRVRELVEAIAPQVHVPPRDASLHVDARGVTCTLGQAGRALDAASTVENVLTALSSGAKKAEIVTIALPPDRKQPEPGCTEARALLSQPFVLLAEDPLTDYQNQFEVTPERLATWLRVVVAHEEILLEIDEKPVEAWLSEVAPQLGDERILAVEETRERTLSALREGDHRARCAIRHAESSYVVQPGDTLFDIAYSHGFPQWRLEEANPDVEPNELLIGMELTIPSIDVLFPEPLVAGKRIEIDLPEQRLRAYENDDLIYDFTCSSGMTSTPTIAGQFQVLFKEREAYAQRWSLEMPYFMAVYYEGPDFANGIHELPIQSNGQRLWASVLGWPASYGCIILDVDDAEKLYHWAPVGTLVRIEGVAPGTPTWADAPGSP